jgi:hypothetical protein
MGVCGQRHAPAALLPPGKWPPVPIVQEAGWAPEPVWTQRLQEKSFLPLPGIELMYEAQLNLNLVKLALQMS